MRRLRVAACALALAGCALAAGSAVATARPSPHPPHQVRVAAAPQVVNVTPAQAGPGDTVTVSGSGFPGGTRAQIYLDGPNHPLGPSVVVGSDGTFTATEVIPAGATQDVHQICAEANTAAPACAQLQVTAAATPTPAPTATPEATPATAAPTAAPAASSTPAPATGGVLGSLFPWILIPIALLVILAVIAIILLARGRRSPEEGAVPPPPVWGDPRGAGRPTVTHYSPRGYEPPEEPPENPAPRGYRRRVSGPSGGTPQLPGRGERPWLPPDQRRGLPAGDEDDDGPFSTPPPR